MNNRKLSKDTGHRATVGVPTSAAVGAQDARSGHSRSGRPGMIAPLLVAAVLTASLTWQMRDFRVFGLGDVFTFTVLLVAAAASAGLRFGRSEERVSFSFTAVVLLAAIPLVGPVGAVLLGIGAAVLDARQGWWQAWVFNGLMFGLSAAVASWVYAHAGGAVLVDGALTRSGVPLDLAVEDRVRVLTTSVGVPLLLADAAFLATNLAVLLMITARDPMTPSRLTVVRGMARTVPTFLAWAIVAFVVVVLWGPGGLDFIALLLVTAPLVVTRHMHGLFSAERRTRASLVEAIAGAGRDEGVRAHDDRVMRYALAIATELGMRPADRDALQAAARLHAVGMPEPCSVAQCAGEDPAPAVARALTSDEVVGRVGFLAAAASAVRFEGEWFDGGGGPGGLVGEEIPLSARVLAVADAADALVSASEAAHPDVDAVSRLRELAGRRFDPVVVAALASAVRVTDVVEEEGGHGAARRPDAPGSSAGSAADGRGLGARASRALRPGRPGTVRRAGRPGRSDASASETREGRP